MTQATQLTGLLCRLYLAVFFFGHAAQYFFPYHSQLWPGAGMHTLHTGIGWQDMAVAGLLALIAFWLVLGIRSRVVALIGFVICSASLMLHGDSWALLDTASVWSGARVAALASVVILALTGGGKWRLHPGGWQLRNCV